MKSDFQYSRILFITALKQESQVLQDLINCKLVHKLTDIKDQTSLQQAFYLLQTGIGNRNFGVDLEALIRKISPDLIINYGICGILDPTKAILQNYLMSTIYSLSAASIDITRNILWKRLDQSRHFFRGRLLTTIKPVISVEKREELRRISSCELVDMEAYPVAKIAQKLARPVIVFKCATDFADETAVETVTSSVGTWQKILGEGLTLILKETEHRTA
jgi:nucleoside phosphorylase